MSEQKHTQRDLTPVELLLMRAIWDGKVTTREVFDKVTRPGEKQLAFTTVATYLERLEHKGFLRRESSGGREYRYIPLLTKEAVRDQMSEKADELFDRSSDLLERVVKRINLPPAERKRLHQIVAGLRKKGH